VIVVTNEYDANSALNSAAAERERWKSVLAPTSRKPDGVTLQPNPNQESSHAHSH
jgi:hypothetical protein